VCFPQRNDERRKNFSAEDGAHYRSTTTEAVALQSEGSPISCFDLVQGIRTDMEEELLKLEKGFAEAIVKNDLERLGRIVADDWIIVDPNGEIVDRARFFEVIKSGSLTHETMESEDLRVRVYGDSAVVTAVTRTKGTFMGQDFSTRERATDVFVKREGRWQCVLTHLTRFQKK
jgi:ketosteroid isomerase-like protein